MKTILSNLALVFLPTLFAQEYTPLLGQNNLWSTLNLQGDEDVYYGGDIEIKLSDVIITYNEKEYTALKMRYRPYTEWGAPTEWTDWAINKIYLHENIEEKKYMYSMKKLT